MIYGYRLALKQLSDDEGGGFFLYLPTLGEGLVYGQGDTFDEALHDLLVNFGEVREILREDYPAPNEEDRLAAQACAVNTSLFEIDVDPATTYSTNGNTGTECAANINFSFAA